MKVFILFGSPRLHGNTAAVLAWVEDQLARDGHSLDRANIIDYSLHGCGECMSCKTGEGNLCARSDEANDIFTRMMAADVVLLATPLFCWGYPAQLKALVDRMYCLVDNFYNNPDYESRLRGKAMGLLVTSGGGDVNNADLLIRGFENMVNFLKGKMAGYFHVPFCTVPEDFPEALRQRAAQFARTLTQA